MRVVCTLMIRAIIGYRTIDLNCRDQGLVRACPAFDGGVLQFSDDETSTGLDGPRFRLLVMILLLVVTIGGAIDLYLDAPVSWLTPHVLYELLLMVLSASGAIYLARGWRRTTVALSSVQGSLLLRQQERDQWRASAERALNGMGQAIDAQFEAWHLTPSERDVAMHLLKGHGHKQTAALTGRSERTVRQHAVAVYQKSGLGGRAEVAAFFLEALVLPAAETVATR